MNRNVSWYKYVCLFTVCSSTPCKVDHITSRGRSDASPTWPSALNGVALLFSIQIYNYLSSKLTFYVIDDSCERYSEKLMQRLFVKRVFFQTPPCFCFFTMRFPFLRLSHLDYTCDFNWNTTQLWICFITEIYISR